MQLLYKLTLTIIVFTCIIACSGEANPFAERKLCGCIDPELENSSSTNDSQDSSN